MSVFICRYVKHIRATNKDTKHKNHSLYIHSSSVGLASMPKYHKHDFRRSAVVPVLWQKQKQKAPVYF